MTDALVPPQPPTVKISSISTERALLEDLVREVRGTRGDVDRIRADIALVAHEQGILKDRVSMIDKLRSEDALRVSKHSDGVKGLSKSDAGQDMQIASLAMKLDDLAKTTASKQEVKALSEQHEELTKSQTEQTRMLVEAAAKLQKFVATPVVKMIGAALLGSFLSWVAGHFGVELPK